jgi:hypothetical protein
VLFPILTPVLLDAVGPDPTFGIVMLAIFGTVWTVTMLCLAFVFYRWLFRIMFHR